MSITERSLRDLGLGLEDGAVYFKENKPFLQVRSYPQNRFSTLFWFGQIEVVSLYKAFAELIREVSLVLNISDFVLRKTLATYSTGNEMFQFPIPVNYTEDDDKILSSQHRSWLRTKYTEIEFARYELSELEEPVILWADIALGHLSPPEKARLEIGISTGFLPDRAMELLLETSLQHLNYFDKQFLEESLPRHYQRQLVPA